ncbi:hypothetical protein RRG08_005989 [Elysia crispata]|uniref:Uncharacterized protein n=1 Tax=Elysia crispata TaxID=231223 RepID=A0AAE0XUN9_9GAST|nr:hypothetical protein RRG08_005989 [Elysia crispata]
MSASTDSFQFFFSAYSSNVSRLVDESSLPLPLRLIELSLSLNSSHFQVMSSMKDIRMKVLPEAAIAVPIHWERCWDCVDRLWPHLAVVLVVPGWAHLERVLTTPGDHLWDVTIQTVPYTYITEGSRVLLNVTITDRTPAISIPPARAGTDDPSGPSLLERVPTTLVDHLWDVTIKTVPYTCITEGSRVIVNVTITGRTPPALSIPPARAAAEVGWAYATQGVDRTSRLGIIPVRDVLDKDTPFISDSKKQLIPVFQLHAVYKSCLATQ